MKGIRVTVLDHETGESQTVEVPPHEYMLLTTGKCHVAATQVYPGTGTHVVTIKGRVSRPKESP